MIVFISQFWYLNSNVFCILFYIFILLLQKTKEMIVLTGAAGFIGSVLLKELNNKGINDIVISDDFSDIEKNRNF